MRMPCRWSLLSWKWLGLLAIPALLAGILKLPVAARDPDKTSGDPPAGLSAQTIDRLNALALQFDTDKNRVLSPREQDELVKFVAQQHGPQWAERARAFLRSADTNGDGSVDEAEWKRAIERLSRQGAAGPTAKQSVMLAMSDGVHLATDVYLPEGDGPFPVILTRTPYHKTEKAFAGPAATLARNGYACVVQDMRGRFDSEGENLPFIGCGWGAHKDGVETLAWIRKQPWCNGKIGTQGGSAMGFTQNQLAGAVPEGLTAQYISCAAASVYRHASYVGGALRKCQVENWTKGNHFDPKALEIVRAHPSYDAYWQGIDTTLKHSVMNVPAVFYGGWFDTFQQGTIDSFVGRQHCGAEGAKGKQKLVIGPWHHGGADHGMVGELKFPQSAVPREYSAERWFEYHLKGIDNHVMDLPPVTYYVMGDTSDPHAPGNQWRQAQDWPIPSTATPYYLGTGGRLSTAKPAGSDAAFVEYCFDPAQPCPTIGGNNLTIARGPRNQNPIESRPDVVLFSTAPLTEPVEVTGRVTAKLFVSSSAVDSDLSVRLCDVYPDGKSYQISDGMLRLRYRKSMEKPEPLTPGQITEASVDCWSTSIVFNKGHRLRVTVTSSNFPRFDVNPGTGQPWSDDGPKLTQVNRIYCDARHASAIILPVVRQAGAITSKQ
jgi:predicted acyl esterase